MEFSEANQKWYPPRIFLGHTWVVPLEKASPLRRFFFFDVLICYTSKTVIV